jgi:prepilin-type N-terminal cleavage/methylation domain-containing protein
MRRTKRGFTLIEILIAMAIAGLIMGVVGSAFYYLMVVPPEQNDRLTATNELRFSLEWIQHDGVQAHNFTSGEYPSYYGHFCSRDDPDDPLCCIQVSYSYDVDNNQLMREETMCSNSTATPVPSMILSSNILEYEDVIFDHGGEGAGNVTVTMTVTLNPDSPNEIVETDSRYIEMRAAQ